MALLNIHEEIMQDQETPWMGWEGGKEGREKREGSDGQMEQQREKGEAGDEEIIKEERNEDWE